MCIVSSCCCFNLRTGSLILGWLGLIGSILQVIGSILNPAGVYLYGLLEGLAFLLTYGTLLYGIYMQKPTWMLLSVVLSMVGIVYLVIAGIAGLFVIETEKYDKNSPMGVIITYIVIYSAFLALAIYLTSVVYSYYKQLKENEKNPSVGVA